MRWGRVAVEREDDCVDATRGHDLHPVLGVGGQAPEGRASGYLHVLRKLVAIKRADDSVDAGELLDLSVDLPVGVSSSVSLWRGRAGDRAGD